MRCRDGSNGPDPRGAQLHVVLALSALVAASGCGSSADPPSTGSAGAAIDPAADTETDTRTGSGAADDGGTSGDAGPTGSTGTQADAGSTGETGASDETGGGSGGSGPFPPAGSNTNIEPVSFWTDQFDTNAYNSYCDPLSDIDDSWKYYGHAYCTDAFTSMYRVTGQTEYLDEALRHVKTIISHAMPSSSLGGQFGDGYMGWISKSHPQASANGREQQLYEIYQWRYVSTMLRVMSEDPAVMAQTKYQEDFEQILEFSETNIFDKWYSRGPDSYVYRSTPHIAAHMALLATNFSELTDDPARRALYEEVVQKINYDMPNYDSSLKVHYQAHPSIDGAYTWTWAFDIATAAGDDVQDVSHANAEMAYYVESEGLAHDWTEPELQPFITTLKTAIFKDAAGDSCSYYVDGSGEFSCWIYDGFLKLGRYDEDLQLMFEGMTNEHGHPFVAHAALNARFLGAAD